MTEDQIRLIKQTWKLFRLISPGIVADTFYTKLFTDYPPVRKMFPQDMASQYKKLIDTLSTVVARLERLDELTDDIAAMAKRHVHYGVKEEHYILAGNALLWTLQQGLGRDWTPEVEKAWTTCYSTLANVMINASGYKEPLQEHPERNDL